MEFVDGALIVVVVNEVDEHKTSELPFSLRIDQVPDGADLGFQEFGDLLLCHCKIDRAYENSHVFFL